MNASIVLTNRARVITPLVTLAVLALMFGPVLVFSARIADDPIKFGIGSTILSVAGLMFAVSAWNAVFEIEIGDEIVTRRLLRKSTYALTDVKQWRFAVPDGPPTQAVPAGNAMLMLKLRDGTHFRGEVNREQAARIATILPAP